MKHILKIEPAISPRARHKIEDILEELGYKVIGGGTHTDGSACDITFDSKNPKDK